MYTRLITYTAAVSLGLAVFFFGQGVLAAPESGQPGPVQIMNPSTPVTLTAVSSNSTSGLPVPGQTAATRADAGAAPTAPPVSAPASGGLAVVTPEGAPSPWVSIPAGARKTYIGIHGGTVPVSLLTAGDGSPMIAQVGLTGSDFLHFLRSGGKPETVTLQDITPYTDVGTLAPDETEAALSASAEQTPDKPALPNKNATVLFAGTAAGDVPVIYATGHSFESMSLVPANWAPFGLTEKALSFEGTVKVNLPPKKKVRRAPRRG